MMKVCYSELDGPEGLSCRLEAAGHAGFAPAGQDIVCAGASTLMQALVYLLAGEENAHADAWEEPDGPRLAVQADAPCAAWVQGAFELAKAGFTLLAERYPDNIRFADVSRRGEQSMMDLQMFAEEAAPAELTIGDLTIHPEAYMVTKRGETIELTHREFELLFYLAKHLGQVMTREHLLQTVWGYDYFGDVRTVDVTVRRLREKIEDNPSHPNYLVTRRGVGYYLRNPEQE